MVQREHHCVEHFIADTVLINPKQQHVGYYCAAEVFATRFGGKNTHHRDTTSYGVSVFDLKALFHTTQGDCSYAQLPQVQ